MHVTIETERKKKNLSSLCFASILGMSWLLFKKKKKTIVLAELFLYTAACHSLLPSSGMHARKKVEYFLVVKDGF